MNSRLLSKSSPAAKQMLVATTDQQINVTVWTIRVALICMVIALAIRTRYSRAIRAGSGEDVSEWLVAAKCLWLIGSLFALIHTFAAMGWYHQWSHALAFADTARQTEALLGSRVGVGIWFNYAFVAIWMFDALWWVGSPVGYEQRPRIIHRFVYGFLIFIAVNGAVVFESGVVRWLGIGAIALLLGLQFLVRKLELGPDDGSVK